MIHQLLNLTRPLFVLDCESTGLAPDARIVEIAFQRWEPVLDAARAAGHDGMTKEWRSLINPGIPIPAAATAVHGITDERMAGCKECADPIELHRGNSGHEFRHVPRFAQIAESLAKGFTDCDFAGKNVRFDLRLIAYEMQLAKIPWSYAGARIIDIDRLEQIAVPRDLSSLYKKYTGEEHDGAHGAFSDVRASYTVIVKQLEAHASLPRDLDALHKLSWPGWLTSDGSFKMVNGVPTCMLKKHRDTPMHRVPTSYYDWILSADFPDDVRQLAQAAKMGKFPECTPDEARAADKRMI